MAAGHHGRPWGQRKGSGCALCVKVAPVGEGRGEASYTSTMHGSLWLVVTGQGLRLQAGGET